MRQSNCEMQWRTEVLAQPYNPQRSRTGLRTLNRNPLRMLDEPTLPFRDSKRFQRLY